MPAQGHQDEAAWPPAVTASSTRVVLVTRAGCHLCEQAADTLAAHLPPDQVTALDVDDDPVLRARFSDHVPVVFLDGRLLAYWVLPAERLVQALTHPHWTPSPPL